jgi:hypothetical protein
MFENKLEGRLGVAERPGCLFLRDGHLGRIRGGIVNQVK